MLVCITRRLYIQLWASYYLLVISYVSTTEWSIQCHQNTPSVSLRLHDPDALAVDLEQAIISVILFTVLFANQIMTCSTAAAHVPLVLSCLPNPSGLAADFQQLILPVICFLPCLLTRCWFVSCQQHMRHQFHLLYTYGKLADFEQVIVLVLLYLALFVYQTLICSMSAALVHWGHLAVYVWFNVCWLWTSHRFNTFIFHLGTVYLHNIR